MVRTHNKAMVEFNKGNVDLAWEIAQEDEGLLSNVTKSVWIEFAAKCAAQAVANSKGYR